MKHYFYVDGEVRKYDSWPGKAMPKNCYFYSPMDTPGLQWARTTLSAWTSVQEDQIPAEFKAQLLLMGVI